MPERDPEFTPRCLKCGSDSIVPDAYLVERGEANARLTPEVGVKAKPDAWLFKGEARVPTRAQVCADCGFVEVYATDPRPLWDAHIDRLSREFGS